MPLGTYACSFVAWRVGADEWKAWAQPKAKASNTEVFIAAETLESRLKEANLSFPTIQTLQRQRRHDPRHVESGEVRVES